MKRFNNIEGIMCCKMKQLHTPWGKGGRIKCKAFASYTNGTHHFCTHHSQMQRYIVRDGDVGKIIARFDTEQELRDNINKYPGMRMQKLTRSHRVNIY